MTTTFSAAEYQDKLRQELCSAWSAVGLYCIQRPKKTGTAEMMFTGDEEVLRRLPVAQGRALSFGVEPSPDFPFDIYAQVPEVCACSAAFHFMSLALDNLFRISDLPKLCERNADRNPTITHDFIVPLLLLDNTLVDVEAVLLPALDIDKHEAEHVGNPAIYTAYTRRLIENFSSTISLYAYTLNTVMPYIRKHMLNEGEWWLKEQEAFWQHALEEGRPWWLEAIRNVDLID